jgi:hypothetical protein
MPGRIVTCRVLNRLGDRCTGEAVDPTAELLICSGTWPRRSASSMRRSAGRAATVPRRRRVDALIPPQTYTNPEILWQALICTHK